MRKTVAKYFQIIAYFPIFLVLKTIFDFEVKGADNIKKLGQEPIIFAANHNSRKFDGFIVVAAIIRSTRKNLKLSEFLPIRLLVFKAFFQWVRFSCPLPFPLSIFVALWLRFNSCIPVKNRRREEYKNLPLESLLQSPIEALKDSENILIFPEGTTGRDNKLRKGKRGVACLHRETGAPIVPVGIQGAYRMFTLKNLLKPRSKRRIIVSFGEPIYDLWKGKDDRERKSLIEGADRVMDCVTKLTLL